MKTYSRRVNRSSPRPAPRNSIQGEFFDKKRLPGPDQRRAPEVFDKSQKSHPSPLPRTQQHTYNGPLSTTSAKNTSQGVFPCKNNLLDTDQRRVLEIVDENLRRSLLLPKTQQPANSNPLSTTSVNSQRQVLSEILCSQLIESNSGALLEQLQTRGQGASLTTSQTTSLIAQSPTLHTAPPKHVKEGSLDLSSRRAKNFLTSNQVSDKAIVHGISHSSHPETRRNKQALPAVPANSAPHQRSELESLAPHFEAEVALSTVFSDSKPDEKPILDSHTPYLNQSSNKRRHHPDSKSPESKKVKRSSIKSYFKPLPPSSSPSLTRSTNIFSDEVDSPSSPPTSPISAGESPKYRPPRKKPRRNLSLKPSLPPVAMEEYPSTWNEAVGNMDDSRVPIFERFLDNEERLDLQPYESAGEMNDGGGVQRAMQFKNGWNQFKRESPLVDPFPSLGVVANTCTGPLNLGRPRAPSKPIDIPGVKKGNTKPSKYEQTRLNALTNGYIECRVCNYMYNETIPAEVQEHSREHKKHTQPQHLSNGVLSDHIWEKVQTCGVHRIHVNPRRTSQKERDWYENALEIAQDHGLASSYKVEELWDEICVDDPTAQTSGPTDEGKFIAKPRKMAPSYKVYVYTIDYEVVSVALAQRVTNAGLYYYGAEAHEHGNVKLDRSSNRSIYVSIESLCTVRDHQRKGYATTLLDHLRRDFIWWFKLEKKNVAISLPTEAGREFARNYFKGAFTGFSFLVADESEDLLETGMTFLGNGKAPEE